jgi:hypothetical protein
VNLQGRGAGCPPWPPVLLCCCSCKRYSSSTHTFSCWICEAGGLTAPLDPRHQSCCAAARARHTAATHTHSVAGPVRQKKIGCFHSSATTQSRTDGGGKGGSSSPDLWNQQVAAFIAVQQHMQCSDIGTGSGGQGGRPAPLPHWSGKCMCVLLVPLAGACCAAPLSYMSS